MKLTNTTHEEDEWLTEAEEAGGIAGHAAEIADRLDGELTKALSDAWEANEELNKIKMQHAAITDAGGTPKGPPETNEWSACNPSNK